VFAGVTLKRQGAASCSTITWILLTSIVARRAAGSGFALRRYGTAPSPWPLFDDIRLIHVDAVVAAHVQSRAVVTESVPSVPADDAEPESEFATVTSHRDVVGAVSEMFDDALPHESASSESTHAANSRARIAGVQSASALPDGDGENG
jgi:hypothetical protein